MSQLLISVTSVEEAKLALIHGADIIDLKDPASGALGALSLPIIQAILTLVDVKKPVSATIGDLAMQTGLIIPAVEALVALKVDFIKIGFLPNDDYHAVLKGLQPIAASGIKLIAVQFAEHQYDSNLMTTLKISGFIGVMLDTSKKNGLSLFDHYSHKQCENFAQQARKNGLSFGLAGSLKLEHIAQAKLYKPNYIGFRGGVCLNSQRQLRLDLNKLAAVRMAL
jgi:uncharacterized protein (UPF0264 family)